MSGRNYLISKFYCTGCGKEGMPIHRKTGQARENGHLKRIYCLNCGCEQNMAEVKPFGKYQLADFVLEFTYGNFDEEGNRKLPYKQFERNLIKEGVI